MAYDSRNNVGTLAGRVNKKRGGATKTGAGGKPQEYDKNTGQYGNGSGASKKTSTDKERKFENLARKVEGRAPLPEPNGITEKHKPTKFRDAMVRAKDSIAPSERWRVDVHSAGEYDKDRMYMSTGGSCVAIEPNGNIVSVCKRAEDSSIRGKDLISFAVKNGGDRLDAFSGLYGFYTKQGFEPVSWVEFDEKYAPDGWDKTRDTPEPVIFFKYTGKITQERLDEFIKRVKPAEDYDVAKAIRDREIKK